MHALSPSRIMEVGLGFWASKTLLSAVELGLFTELGTKSMTGSELQKALQLDARANPDFFDALVALRFLERDGDGADGRYRNAEDTAAFLDRHGLVIRHIINLAAKSVEGRHAIAFGLWEQHEGERKIARALLGDVAALLHQSLGSWPSGRSGGRPPVWPRDGFRRR